MLSSEELVVVSTPKLLMSVLILPEKLSKDSKKMTLQTQVSLLITLEIMSEIVLGNVQTFSKVFLLKYSLL